MKVNYQEISQIYDDVRQADIKLLETFLSEVIISRETKILDIGCGTGNYTSMLQHQTGARVFGVDASTGMLAKARSKNKTITFVNSSATQLPFEDGFFNFVYMTDVIHHIPNRVALFAEIHRVLAKSALACIATQSHQQIDNRYVTEFFPATAVVDKKRYPDVAEVVQKARTASLEAYKIIALNEDDDVELDDWFLELVRKKGYSMFHLISDSDYEAGLSALSRALNNGPIMRKSAGDTLIWLKKTL